MKFSHFALTLSLFITCHFSIGQNFFSVPDSDLQQFFTANYPLADTIIGGNYFIDGDHPTILAEDSLIFPNANIVDASGVEAFVNLIHLDISLNNVSILPEIPPLVTFFNAYGANLTSLPPLPTNLEVLILTSNTQINTLPALPTTLQTLTCVQNNLSTLPTLPSTLIELNCSWNSLTTLPTLPPNLELLRCDNNPITVLPTIPNSLRHFNFQSCDISVFPNLPNELYLLNCNNNNLSSIPSIPDSVYTLRCNGNQLTSLPSLPEILQVLDCAWNQLTCLPVLPDGIYDLNFSNNAISCLPNYTPFMSLAQLNLPLCVANDPVNNPNGCNQAEGVSGLIFKDTANNCTEDLWHLQGVPLRLEDDQNNFLQVTQSSVAGTFMFAATPSNYIVKVDTNALPNSVEATCPAGLEYAITTTSSSPVSFNNDFGLQCNGFDIAALGGIPKGLVFPGQTHVLKLLAGDVSNFANMSCASGISGEVTVSVSGPMDTIVFNGNATLINDSTATYSIADFGLQALDTIFLDITTDTLATITDSFRISMFVTTPILGDIDISNDTVHFIYPCINSYDPNKKVVFPEDVEVGYEDPFTYTIYFQNTGNATAINIRLEDFIDPNLNLESFQLISASHDQTYSINAENRKLTVRYNDIFLPDSISEPIESIGYFHYRIKPLPNLPVGTIIENTASIFFDFNAPIVTNTTENLFYDKAGITPLGTSPIKLFPNPTKDELNLRSDALLSGVSIYSIEGKMMFTDTFNSKSIHLSVADYPNGIYLVHVNTPDFKEVIRFVKQN